MATSPYDFPLRLSRRLVVYSLLACCSLSTVAASGHEAGSGSGTSNRLHGPLGYLRKTLEISPANSRLLNAAVRDLGRGEATAGCEALLQVFSGPDDIVAATDGASPGSCYQRGLNILATTDAKTLSVWVDSAEPLAQRALLQANGDSDLLAKVARNYPWTPSGIQAHLATGLLARSRGQHHVADAILREIKMMPLRKPGVFPQQLHSQLHNDFRITFSQIASQPAAPLRSRLSLPWPKAKWEWTELLWEYPQINGYSALLQPSARSLYTLNSWHPTLYGDSLFVKTPFHVVAFDKSSGSVRWSLTTDTMMELKPSGNTDDSTTRTKVNLVDLLRRDSMGTLAVSDNFVFFVDHFRVLDAPRSNLQFRNPQRFPNNNLRMQADDPNGDRLVAVKRGARPSVAWAIGNNIEFGYQLSVGAISSMDTLARKADKSASREVDAKQSADEKTVEFDPRHDGEFSGQHFCGVPLIHDRMLFVVSQDRKSYWLNCLFESTGRVVWKKHLAYVNEQGDRPGRFLETQAPDKGASLCGVAGDVVVCSLNSGVVLGTRITDGQFLWATNLRDEVDAVSQINLQRLLQSAIFPTGMRSQPMLQGERLYWAAPFSSNVHCLNTTTGAVVWKVPRSNVGKGRLEGSTDRYVVGATNAAAITIGTRHVRALSIEDGSELWVTSIGRQTGRAFANQASCLIPAVDGSLIQIDLADGRRSVLPETVSQTLAENSSGRIGAVVGDDDVICVATPLSVSVAENPQAVLNDSSRTEFERAMANILVGDVGQGLDGLERVRIDGTNANSFVATKLLAESLLSLDGTELHGAMNAVVDRLSTLPLDAEQKIRRAIRFGAAGSGLDNLNLGDSLPTLALSHDWSARADVAASSHLTAEDAQYVSDFNDVNRSFRSRLEHAILFPDHVGGFEQQLAFYHRLLGDQRHVAAELFLLAVREAAAPSEVIRIDGSLQKLRTSFNGNHSQAEGDVPRVEVSKLKFSEKTGLSAVSGISLLRDRIRMHVDSPAWYSDRLFVVGRSLVSASFSLGVETARLQLPNSPGDILKLPDALETPSIIPVASNDSVGVISLLNPDGPRILWWRNLERDEFDVAPIQVGPFGAKYLMVSFGAEFRCLHPLTGNELWRRKTSDDIPRQGMQSRFPRLVGNHSVMARPGQRLKSYERFRTLDGGMLDTSSIEILDGQIPICSGHSILYLKDRRLMLRELRTEKNLLSNHPEIKVAGAGQALQLSNHRAVTLTDDMEILVLNLLTGDVETRCSVAEIIDIENVAGIRAFERNESLFIVLKDWESSRNRRRASSRTGELRLDSGILCRIDRSTGKLLWHRDIDSCVAPIIYGSETNLMITWAWESRVSVLEQRLQGRQPGNQSNNVLKKMVVTAIDIDTGKTVGEGRELNPAEPMRCVHDDLGKLIMLESDTSTILLNYN